MAENTNPFNYRNIAKAFMPKANPNGLTPDGTTVARVRRRDQGSNDFMGQIVELFGRLLGQQRPNQTPENLRAIRNNPADEYNKASQDPSNPRFMQGNNVRLPGVGLVGPNTAAMLETGGLTPEQLAQMQGPTAMNQWKFPELFNPQPIQTPVAVEPEPAPQPYDFFNLNANQVTPKPTPKPKQGFSFRTAAFR